MVRWLLGPPGTAAAPQESPLVAQDASAQCLASQPRAYPGAHSTCFNYGHERGITGGAAKREAELCCV